MVLGMFFHIDDEKSMLLVLWVLREGEAAG
jgi:hypothetical protein